jgi:hypothetical protein
VLQARCESDGGDNDRLGILTLLQHALHVTVGIKLNPISARFNGIEAAHARWRNAGDIVITLLC